MKRTLSRTPLLRPLLLLFLWVGLTAGSHAQTDTGSQTLDRVVAVVNDDVILSSELDRKLRLVREQLQQKDTPAPPEANLQRQVLEQMILENLQLQVAERTGIKVDDVSLGEAINNIAKQNQLSLSEFRAVLAREGYDFDRFREDIRHEMMIGRLRQRQVGNLVVVSDQEVANFLASQGGATSGDREYHLAHILIAVPEAAAPERIQKAKSKAEETLRQLQGGADFRQVAVSVSDGQQALEGGDLGWRKAGELPSLFADKVTTMQPGDLVGPMRSPSGFHIIKLLETRGSERHVVTQTRVRHILLRPNEVTSQEDVRLRLEQLKQRIEGGDSFAELARSHSEDTASAIKGGELGWVKPGDLVPEFEEVMNGLEPNQVSAPFKTRFGWHILQVLDRRRQDDTQEFRATKAKEMIHQRKYEEELQSWLRRLRDEAYVEYRLDQP